jgi:predicted nucleic acid-binding protein
MYWDTSYLARLYVQDPGWQPIRELATSDRIACSFHGRVELVAALHRKLREGMVDASGFAIAMQAFNDDCRQGAFQWLPISSVVIDRTVRVYAKLPTTAALRGADALHLASAAENGLKVIYSNDRQLLNAANDFGLSGVNII